MKTNKALIILIWIIYAIALNPAFPKDSVERIFWDKKPLKITLPVNKERMITFPTPVRIGLPVEINSQLRTQINNNTVNWLAYESFKSQRI